MGECRRSDVLRGGFRGSLSWSSYVRGQDLERREAGRPPRRAAHQVRAGDQPQDRQSSRTDDPAVAPAEGGSGDRVRNRRQRQNLEGWTRERITPAPPVPKPTRPPRRPPARPPAPPKPR